MITIREAKGEEAARLLSAAGIAPPAVCLVLLDGDHPCGQVFYRRSGEDMELLAVSAGGPAEEEGLLRAAMNAAQLAGARTVRCCTAALFPTLQRLGFERDESAMAADIAAFFARPCRGGGA